MKLKVYILAAALLLGGCSALKDAAIGALTGGSGGLSVDTSLEVIDGDKTETIETSGSKTETNVTAEKVSEVSSHKQEAQTIVNNQVSMDVLVLIIVLTLVGLLGWILPEPEFIKRWRS